MTDAQKFAELYKRGVLTHWETTLRLRELGLTGAEILSLIGSRQEHVQARKAAGHNIVDRAMSR